MFSCSNIKSQYPSYKEKFQIIDQVESNVIIKNITRTRIPPFESNDFVEKINSQKNDTIYYIDNQFKGGGYNSSLMISSEKILDTLIIDLEKSLNYMKQENNEYRIERLCDYRLSKFKNSKKIFIYNFDPSFNEECRLRMGQYMSEENVKLWIEWLKTINLP